MAEPVVPPVIPVPPTVGGTACVWPVSYDDCVGGDCSAYEKWEEGADRDAAIERFETQAVDLLWNWTNRLFGECTVEYRPCQENCAGAESWGSTFWGRSPGYDPGFPRSGGSGWLPVLIAGKWYNTGCGTCAGACSCGVDGAQVLRLPGPVLSVEEIMVDGVILDPTEYRLDYGHLLIRTDGSGWPTCQNMLAPVTADDTFQILYTKGITVPAGGQAAAGRLACQLAKAACNDADCELPQRIQTLSRQGVTIGFQDSFEDLKEGGTGIWTIDAWITSVTRKRTVASVRSVDVAPPSVGGLRGY